MSVFKFDIDAKDFLKALDKLPGRLSKRVRVAIKEGLWDIAEFSGKHHRYTARSGNLDASYTVKLINDFIGEVLLDLFVRNAPYAHAIHDGRPDWPNYRPDQFLFKATKIKEKEFVDKLEKAVSKAISDVGF